MNESTKTSERALQVANHGEVAVLSPPRLPWHPAIGERFGVDRVGWKALVEAVFPNARETNSVVLALAYCQARKLDPMKRMVHIVPMWQKGKRFQDANGRWQTEKGRMVDTVWPSIAELRVTAFRTGQYAGKDEIELGPLEKKTFTVKFENQDDDTGEVTTTAKEVTVEFPLWGRITVHRLMGNGHVGKFVGPKLRWLEEYGRVRSSDMPNDMWARRPFDQFEKVVEAAALRCAFPEEIGNEYSAEEMDGKTIDASPTPATETRQVREEPQQRLAIAQDTAPLQPKQEPREEMPPDLRNEASEPKEEMPPEQEMSDDLQWLAIVARECDAIVRDPTKTVSDLAEYQKQRVVPEHKKRPLEIYRHAMDKVKEAVNSKMLEASQQ